MAIFTSKNGLFSSTNEENVIRFEAHGISSKQDIFNDRELMVEFLYAGNCPLAWEVFNDEARIGKLVKEHFHALLRGNWSHFKVKRELFELRKQLWIDAGYDTSGRDYIHDYDYIVNNALKK